MLPILKAQSKWGWEIAAYLFLAGLGAGAYFAGVAADIAGCERWAGISKIGVSLGFPCVLVGCAFLLADLGSPVKFWRAGFRPNTAWIARGTLIITIFMFIAAFHVAFGVWPSTGLSEVAGVRYCVGVMGAIFALCTIVYTGVLLAASRPIAFWSTAMLPLLFLISALSTGIMAIILVAALTRQSAEQIGVLAMADIVLIVIETIVLAFYLQATHRVPESRASAELVLKGSVAPLFWWGVVVVGLATPLALEMLGVFVLGGEQEKAMALAASVCGMAGGLCLRQVVLSGGIHAPLRAGRFEIGLPIV